MHFVACDCFAGTKGPEAKRVERGKCISLTNEDNFTRAKFTAHAGDSFVVYKKGAARRAAMQRDGSIDRRVTSYVK